MNDERENKNKTISFRVSEDVHEDLSSLEQSMSEIYRGMTELYLQDPFFANGVNAYLDDDVQDFEQYAQAYFEASAEFYAKDLIEEYDRPVDATELKEPIMDYGLNAAAGYKTGTEDAVEDIKEVDQLIGHVFEVATEKFSDDHWDENLE